MPSSKYKPDSNGKKTVHDVNQVVSDIEVNPKTKKHFFTYLDEDGKPVRNESKSTYTARKERARVLKQMQKRRDSLPAPLKKKIDQIDKKRESKSKAKDKVFSLRDHFEEIAELYLNGKGEYFIADHISEKYEVNYHTVRDSLMTGGFKSMFASTINKDAEEIILTHTYRYEKLYEWFKSYSLYKYAAKMLRYKEKLLGLNENLSYIRQDFELKAFVGIDVLKIQKNNNVLNGADKRFEKLLGKVKKIDEKK